MSDFFAMGGYGFYVWTSFGLFVLVLALDALAPLLKRRRILRELRARLRRAQPRNEESV